MVTVEDTRPPVSRRRHARTTTIRFGNPWAASGYLALLLLATVFLGTVCLTGIGKAGSADPGARLVLMLVLAPATVLLAALLLAVLAVLVRNPRLLLRTIQLTPNRVTMPRRRRGRIDMADVAGVGLAFRPRTGGRRGLWGVAVWTADGDPCWAAGVQRTARLGEPETTVVARAAEAVHHYVAERQGPAGLLTTRARQRDPQWPPSSPLTRAWDPAPPGEAPTQA